MIFASYGDKLPGLMAELLVMEEFCHHVHPAGVSYKYDIVSEFLRTDMDMERRAVIIDYKLRLRDSLCFFCIHN